MKYIPFYVSLFTVIALYLSGCSRHAPTQAKDDYSKKETVLYPVWDSAYRIGYIDEHGKTIVPCQYYGGTIFSNNRAFVLVDVQSPKKGVNYMIPSGYWQMIDTKGNLVGKPVFIDEYNSPPYFYGDLFISKGELQLPYMDRYSSYMDTLGKWHNQYSLTESEYDIKKMIFYDSFAHNYSIKNKGLRNTSFVSKYAILKLNNKSILIDTAQNHIANLPDSLSFVESVHGKYLVCRVGEGDGDIPEGQKDTRYRVVIDTNGRQYCSFSYQNSYSAFNNRLVFRDKGRFLSYYDILNEKYVHSQHDAYLGFMTFNDTPSYLFHSSFLGNSLIIFNAEKEKWILYDEQLNIIRSDIHWDSNWTHIGTAKLSLVKIGQEIGYMNERGQLVWSKPIDEEKHLYRRPYYMCSIYGDYIRF